MIVNSFSWGLVIVLRNLEIKIISLFFLEVIYLVLIRNIELEGRGYLMDRDALVYIVTDLFFVVEGFLFFIDVRFV